MTIDIQKVVKTDERKNVQLTVKVTPTTRQWMRENHISPQRLLDESIRILKEQNITTVTKEESK